MFGADNGLQLYQCFRFGGLGFLLGAYYDLFRVWRIVAHSGKIAVFFQDLLFCLSSALSFFLAALAVTGGILRWYLAAGVLLGLAAYRVTVGLIFVRLVRRLVCFTEAAARVTGRLLTAPIRKITRLLSVPLAALGRLLKKAARKMLVFFKKVLKSGCSLLYTKNRLRKQTHPIAEGDTDSHEKQ